MLKQTHLQIFSFIISGFIFGGAEAFAQDTLSLSQAISETLEKNYGLKIVQYQVDAAENQIYRGNAGMLPELNWNTTIGGNLNHVNQVFLDDRRINRIGYAVLPNSSLQLTWTLYDGHRMQAVYDRLKTAGQQSLIQQKLAAQRTVYQTMQTYYEILRQEKAVAYLHTILSYYDERLKLTEERWSIGRGSKLDFLQSKADHNAQKTMLAEVRNLLKTRKIQLNELMASPSDRDFEPKELHDEPVIYDLQSLIANALQQNNELLILDKDLEISVLNEKEVKSFRKPRLSLNSGFGYAFSRSNAGILALNQSLGLTTGLTASWNIFNGRQTERDIELAKINTEITKSQKENTQNRIENELTAAYHAFEGAKELLALEEENRAVAKENLDIALEKFRLGASTILELNEAQQRFDSSLNRLVNAEYNRRIAELELLWLSGTLLN